MLDQLNKWLETKSKFDGFLVSKPENIYYCCGFSGSFGFLIIQPEKKPQLVTDGRYAETATALAQKNGFEFVLFDADFKDTFGNALSGNFACEDSLTLAQLERFKKYFPAISFKSQKQVLEQIRRVKSDDEIAKIHTAQTHVDELLWPFLKENLKTGISERALNFKLQQALQAEGKFGLSFPSIIAFGENSSRPHHVSGERTLQLDDNILVDCGVVHDHYCSDMTRNFIFGTPSKAYLKTYELLLGAQQATSKKITAGASSQSIDAFCREQLGDEAEFFTHSLGHGVGLEIHELPNLSPRKNYTLQAGEVVTNEPGLYYPGEFGIRIEDLLVVTSDQPRILSQSTRDLLSLGEDGQVKTWIKAA